MKKFTQAIMLVACFGISWSAHATLIDFEGFPSAGGTGNTYSEDGFSITTDGADHILNNTPSNCSPACAFNGTQTLLQWINDGGSTATLVADDGSAFSLINFDAAESFTTLSNLWASTIRIDGVLSGGGLLSTSFALDFINDGGLPGSSQTDFQTFTLPSTFSNLTSVSFIGLGSSDSGSNEYILDNINIGPAQVPEPATLALFGIGLAGMGFARKKRKSV